MAINVVVIYDCVCAFLSARPSHADLPCISTPPLPGKGLDEAFLSDVNQPLGAREHTSRNDPDIYHQPVNQVGGTQSVTAERIHDRFSAPIREEEQGTHALYAEMPSFHPHQTRPTSHRKAHRKTNRRKCSNDDDSPPLMNPDSDLQSHAQLKRYVCTQSGPSVDTGPPSQLRPWCSWHKERREAHKEVFSLDQCKLLDQTIEEVCCSLTWCFVSNALVFINVRALPQVIQKCCHGVSSTSCDEEKFFYSLPVSMDTQSDDSDSVVQVSQSKAL